jgi:hypothetical protein
MPKRYLLSVLVLLIAAASGCGAKSSDSDPQNAAEFKALLTLYYAMARTGQPPKNEEEFKSQIRGNLAPMLEKLAVTDADGLFTSKRDGKPLVILYGSRPSSGAGQDVVAYEQDGVDGKRLVGFSLGMVEEADQARFDELVPKK